MRDCYDVVVVGGGIVGLSVTLAMAMLDPSISLALLEENNPIANWPSSALSSRVSTINLASQQMLKRLGVWEDLRNKYLCPVKSIVVKDKVGQGEIVFSASDLGTPVLAHVVDNRELLRVLWKRVSALSDRITVFSPQKPNSVIVQKDRAIVKLVNGSTLNAKLVVGADGGSSWLRAYLGMSVIEKSYHQVALVAVVATSKSHGETAMQQFAAQGILALLPLTDSSEETIGLDDIQTEIPPYRGAIVWSMDKAQAQKLLAQPVAAMQVMLTSLLGDECGPIFLLTKPKALDLVMRHAKCYVKSRVAFIGDAVRTIHPLAGLGVNLGLIDAACLADIVFEARGAQRDIGVLPILKRYERWRRLDNCTMIAAMRAFKEGFGCQQFPVPMLRSMGLNGVNRFEWLKRHFIRYATGDVEDLPSLARAKC